MAITRLLGIFNCENLYVYLMPRNSETEVIGQWDPMGSNGSHVLHSQFAHTESLSTTFSRFVPWIFFECHVMDNYSGHMLS